MHFQQIKTGKGNITELSNEIISSISRIKAFESTDMNQKLYELHKQMLTISMDKNKSYEVGIFWNLTDTDNFYIIRGTKDGIDMSDNEQVKRMVSYGPACSVAILHNHPRNGLFSYKDLSSFIAYNSIYIMTAVCNDGTIYMIRKEENFDPYLLNKYYSEGIHQNVQNISKRNGTGKFYYNGIKNVAKHAKQIGITYRCSIKRKEVSKCNIYH